MTTHRLQLSLRRGSFALEVDIELPPRGITVLFGPSGSGKTTVLRCIAGLERARGQVVIAGETWQDDSAGVFRPTWQRPLGYVFQEPSLFPHLTVGGNLAYARRRAAGDGGIPLDRVVQLLGLGHLLDRRPDSLSGGERQRVAIARAVATEPRLLLLDEPLASLDPARRRELLPWLEELRDRLGLPMLYVTHSVEEMARLADTLLLLEGGHVQAAGSPTELLAQLDLPLARDEDAGALLEGRVAQRDLRWHLARVEFEGGSIWLRDEGLPVGAVVRLRVLARDVSVALVPPAPGTLSIQNVLPCTVQAIAPGVHPSQVVLQLACGNASLLARITGRAADQLQLAAGRSVWAQVKSAALVS